MTGGTERLVERRVHATAQAAMRKQRIQRSGKKSMHLPYITVLGTARNSLLVEGCLMIAWQKPGFPQARE